ncbi:MAG: LTA synthase family protein [Lachnospiraceae bacterium]|nr:LTA synthase family protein [Lachnospiraceae bacterium]
MWRKKSSIKNNRDREYENRNQEYDEYTNIERAGIIIRTLVCILIFLFVPVLLFYLMESYEHNAFVEVRQLAQVYNILLFELIAWILFFIFGTGKIALRIETILAMVYGITNYYIMAFRSTPFVPWDIFSIRTAVSVADNYDFTPSKEMIMTTSAFLVIFVLLGFFEFRLKQKFVFRMIPMACMSVALGVFVGLLQDEKFQTKSYLYPYLFTPAYMTEVNGMAVTFAMDLAFLYVEKPNGYSVEVAKAILEQYEDKENTQDTDEVAQVDKQELPNIIVIMNEAFSDLSVLGEFTTNEDYMPYLHELQNGNENTITGNMTVSVCGGNTANSEFEFLTGHTMDFFPVGSIPYQQYIKGEIPSLASQLKALGYETYGMHPYLATGWNRDTVYPNLGFSENYFLTDFTKRQYIRKYVSDATAYDKIIETYEKKEKGTPAFIFEVTMQNHGGYTDTYKNFTSNIEVEEFEHKALNQYLSLLQVSDAELEKLIAYFNKEEEKTIIVFFGDHQPNDYVVNPILQWNRKSTLEVSKEETAKLRYVVPYLIWANYDIEEKTNADTDISLLSANMLEVAGLPTTAYQNFLLEMEKALQEVSNKSESEQESVKAEYEEMYQILQYYFMFDV